MCGRFNQTASGEVCSASVCLFDVDVLSALDHAHPGLAHGASQSAAFAA